MEKGEDLGQSIGEGRDGTEGPVWGGDKRGEDEVTPRQNPA